MEKKVDVRGTLENLILLPVVLTSASLLFLLGSVPFPVSHFGKWLGGICAFGTIYTYVIMVVRSQFRG